MTAILCAWCLRAWSGRAFGCRLSVPGGSSMGCPAPPKVVGPSKYSRSVFSRILGSFGGQLYLELNSVTSILDHQAPPKMVLVQLPVKTEVICVTPLGHAITRCPLPIRPDRTRRRGKIRVGLCDQRYNANGESLVPVTEPIRTADGVVIRGHPRSEEESDRKEVDSKA